MSALNVLHQVLSSELDYMRWQMEKPLYWGVFQDRAAYEERMAKWIADGAAFEGRVPPPLHGPWLYQVMPEHLWPDNEWWWLPEEYEDG